MNKSILNKKLLFYILTLIVFIEPQGFKELGSQFYYVDYVYKGLKLIFFFFVLLLFLGHKDKQDKFDKFIIATFVYQVFMLVSTIINHGDIVRFIGPSITIITMAMLIKLIIKDKLLLSTVKTLNIYFVICYIINLISMILIGKSETTVYFLGIDNRFIWTFFPWIICVGIESLLTKKKIGFKYYCTLFLIEIILLSQWSVAAMLSMLLFAFLGFFNFKKIGYKIICCLNIITNYVVTKINFATVPLVKNAITNLHKDVTFSGRTYLWNGIYSTIKGKLLFGVGTQSIATERKFFYTTSGSYHLSFLNVMHGHNSFMTILYRGGLLSLVSYIYILFISMKKLFDNKNNLLFPLLVCGYIVIFVLSLFDTIDFAFLFFFFGISYYIKNIVIEGELNE